MSYAPTTILYDSAGNPVSVINDSGVYRMGVDGKLKNTSNAYIDPATEGKQDTIIANQATIETDIEAINAKLADLSAISIPANTTGMPVISYPHGKVHDSLHYGFHKWVQSINVGDNVDFLLKVPAFKYPHLTFSFRSEERFTAHLYETPTTSADGSLQTSYNSNFNSAETADLAIYYTPTVSAVGTEKYVIFSGGNNEAGQGGNDEEKILKQGLNYLLRFTSQDNGNQISVDLEWYEN